VIGAIDTILSKVTNDGEVVCQGAFRAIAGLAWCDANHNHSSTGAGAITSASTSAGASASGSASASASGGKSSNGTSSSASNAIQTKFSELPEFCRTVVKVRYNEFKPSYLLTA
jgi:hypothetical protein